jgi:hypothetical protein
MLKLFFSRAPSLSLAPSMKLQAPTQLFYTNLQKFEITKIMLSEAISIFGMQKNMHSSPCGQYHTMLDGGVY